MSKVALEPTQYIQFDEDGSIISARAVKVHTLSEKSESGPGICAVLRTGFEPENGGPIFGDGMGVSLTITDEQLNKLGYLTKAQVKQAIVKLFPDFATRTDERACGQRVVLSDLTDELRLTNAYTLDDKARKAAQAAAAVPEDLTQQIASLFMTAPIFPEPEKKDEPVNFLGGDVTKEELDEALKRAGLRGHVHFLAYYRCAFHETLMSHVEDIRREKAQPPKYAYCGECKAMVDPYEMGFSGRRSDRVMHDINLEVYCKFDGKWVSAYTSTVLGHSVAGPCIDRTGNRVHPEVK